MDRKRIFPSRPVDPCVDVPLSRIGAWAGITGTMAFGLLWTAAVIADGSWAFGEDTLSELGRMDGGGRDIFNSAVILASILWMIFTLGLYSILQRRWSTRVGGALFFISAFSLLGIGIFPIDSGTPHTVASWSFFIGALVSLLILALPVSQTECFGRLGLVPTLVAPLISLSFLIWTTVPLAEAVAVMCLMAWAVIMSALILLHVPRRKGLA